MEANKEFVKCRNCEKEIAELTDTGMIPKKAVNSNNVL